MIWCPGPCTTCSHCTSRTPAMGLQSTRRPTPPCTGSPRPSTLCVTSCTARRWNGRTQTLSPPKSPYRLRGESNSTPGNDAAFTLAVNSKSRNSSPKRWYYELFQMKCLVCYPTFHWKIAWLVAFLNCKQENKKEVKRVWKQISWVEVREGWLILGFRLKQTNSVWKPTTNLTSFTKNFNAQIFLTELGITWTVIPVKYHIVMWYFPPLLSSKCPIEWLTNAQWIQGLQRIKTEKRNLQYSLKWHRPCQPLMMYSLLKIKLWSVLEPFWPEILHRHSILSIS